MVVAEMLEQRVQQQVGKVVEETEDQKALRLVLAGLLRGEEGGDEVLGVIKVIEAPPLAQIFLLLIKKYLDAFIHSCSKSLPREVQIT